MLAARLICLLAWLAAFLTGRAADPASPSPAGTSLANLAAAARLSLLSITNATSRVTVPIALATQSDSRLSLAPGQALECEWDQPRAVRSVVLQFTEAPHRQEPFTVEWWRRIWPDNGAGGWMKLDDPFNGAWTTVQTTVQSNQPTEFTAAFAPLEPAEAPGIKRHGMPERQTYKLRIRPNVPLSLRQLRVHSDAVVRTARLRFEWNVRTAIPGVWNPRFEVRNGRLLGSGPAGTNAARVELEYVDAPDRLSADRGHVLFRSGPNRSFAVFVDDVLREGGLFVRDIGVFVSDADRGLAFSQWPGPAGDVWSEGTVAAQVARLPEQSFDHVANVIPLKPPPYLFLGAPNLRQEIALHPGGQIELRADSLRSPGPDAAARPWKDEALVYDFSTGASPVLGPESGRVVTRSLEAGWLPVVRHEWAQDELAWSETCLAAPLIQPIATLESRTGTEPLVLAARFEVRNSSPTNRTATLWLELSRRDPLRLAVDGTLVLHRPSAGGDRPGFVPVRGRFDTHRRGELALAIVAPTRPGSFNPRLASAAQPREAVRYRVELAPQETHAVDLFVPYVELLEAREAAALKGLTFTNLHDSVVAFWQERTGRGMTLEVPDRHLNELFKANLWHVLISTDLDPVTGQSQHGAATHQYGNFLNETTMVARSLEMRGEHVEALRLLAPFLANQGDKGLPGNFQSREGVLYAAHPGEPDPYTAQGYNLHHGFGLWALAEHYFWTRDTNYLRAVTEPLTRAADWVTRERQATRLADAGANRRVEHGLLPAGDLEDVEEYLSFYAPNAYAHLGMQTLAGALADLRPPPPGSRNTTPATEAESRLGELATRIQRDTAAYREDIQASVAESVATSPVVRLRDGTYVPFVPPRAHALTHLKEGWIREGLYPALHLVDGGLFEPRHPYVDWMIHELEDNVFLSPECGYGLTNARTAFFDQGGFTLQPNLLDLALVYLRRDEVPNFLRAFYNSGWASLHPDTACFAEWVPAFGQAGGPLYKTPDECKFIQWLRSMLVLEDGESLDLGLGVPRAWMADGKRIRMERAATWFGAVDLEIISHAAQRVVTAQVALRPTHPPAALRLRLRDPEGRPLGSAEVNGTAIKPIADRQLIPLPLTTNRWNVTARF